ncbi:MULTISPECIES: hypothetical protein [Clostridium]|uniref:Uncharacterized protein n=1 Tax=Clostridium lapidicellarium TaxID=3240931 RepID=A0ABV4DV15_9CLOT|nr:hypothetical protein [uncultured Clostridium sp.]
MKVQIIHELKTGSWPPKCATYGRANQYSDPSQSMPPTAGQINI